MKISLIAAAAQNGVIGINGGLPWHLPNDLRYFKQKTLHHHVIMGRKTFSEFGIAKPLPNRVNIIISRNKNAQFAGCLTAHSIEDALLIALHNQETEAFVIGGQQIYLQALPYAHCIYLTQVHATIQGDTFFPSFNQNEWQLIHSQPHLPDEKHAYAYTFTQWQRTSPPPKIVKNE